MTAARVSTVRPKTRLVDDAEADHGINEVGVDAQAREDADEEGEAVTEREQRDIEDDVAGAVQEEDDGSEEQDVVPSGHHVFGAQEQEREAVHALGTLQKPGVLLVHPVGGAGRGGKEQGSEGQDQEEQGTEHRGQQEEAEPPRLLFLSVFWPPRLPCPTPQIVLYRKSA
jgi:ClpP class serine protease